MQPWLIWAEWTQLKGVLCVAQMNWRMEWASQLFLWPQHQDSLCLAPMCHAGEQDLWSGLSKKGWGWVSLAGGKMIPVRLG